MSGFKATIAVLILSLPSRPDSQFRMIKTICLRPENLSGAPGSPDFAATRPTSQLGTLSRQFKTTLSSRWLTNESSESNQTP